MDFVSHIHENPSIAAKMARLIPWTSTLCGAAAVELVELADPLVELPDLVALLPPDVAVGSAPNVCC